MLYKSLFHENLLTKYGHLNILDFCQEYVVIVSFSDYQQKIDSAGGLAVGFDTDYSGSSITSGEK